MGGGGVGEKRGDAWHAAPPPSCYPPNRRPSADPVLIALPGLSPAPDQDAIDVTVASAREAGATRDSSSHANTLANDVSNSRVGGQGRRATLAVATREAARCWTRGGCARCTVCGGDSCGGSSGGGAARVQASGGITRPGEAMARGVDVRLVMVRGGPRARRGGRREGRHTPPTPSPPTPPRLPARAPPTPPPPCRPPPDPPPPRRPRPTTPRPLRPKIAQPDFPRSALRRLGHTL